jgi:hypothetical protein
MTTYKTKLGQPNSRGVYPRNLGKQANGRPYKFYVGKDADEAERRIARLEGLWEVVSSCRGVWDADTLLIGKTIAKGESKCVLPRRVSDDMDAIIGVVKLASFVPSDSDLDEIYAERFDGFAERFGQFVTLIPGDHAAYVAGHQSMGDRTRRTIVGVQEMLTLPKEANVLEMETTTLHEAFDKYVAEYIRKKPKLRDLTTGNLTDWGNTQVRMVERQKEVHANRPLHEIKLPEVKSMCDHWRSRPMVKVNGKREPHPMAPSTVKHHIWQVKNFFQWVDDSDYRWTAPNKLDRIPLTCELTPEEKSKRVTPTQVDTWTIDELVTLYQHATELERVYLLLGLNCGFAPAEFGSLRLSEVFLHQRHGWDKAIKYRSNPNQSWIKRIRIKNEVYGEWLLWPQTVQAMEWAIARRHKMADFRPDTFVMLTKTGLSYIGQTKGGNHSTKVYAMWRQRLIKRILKLNPKFRKLPPKSLRKTSGNEIRDIADGEIQGVHLSRGQVVKTDDLAEIYSNRPFRKVFEALEEFQQRLQPLWDAVPDPFPDDE